MIWEFYCPIGERGESPMRIDQKVIQTAYHFFSEGIILILLLGPFFNYTLGEIPYWTALTSLFIITGVFSILTIFTEKVIWYLLMAPIIGSGYFFILDFTLFLSIVVARVLTWRYIVLRQDSHLENENKYLISTTILVIIYVLFAGENSAVVYLFLQFFALMVGYITNHTVSMPHDKKKRMTYGLGKLFLLLVVVLASLMGLLHLFGVPALFVVWDVVVVNLWNGIALIVAYIGVAFMYVLQFFINLFPMSDEGQTDSDAGNIGVGEEELIETTPGEMVDFNIGWIFTVLLLTFILYQAFKIYRKRFKHDVAQDSTSVTHMRLTDKQTARDSLVSRLRQRFFSKPNDPIRKVVYRFERETKKRNLGRQSFETVNEWFSRIGLDADTSLYEKVRYGGEQASSMEVEILSRQLKEWFNK